MTVGLEEGMGVEAIDEVGLVGVAVAATLFGTTAVPAIFVEMGEG
jgi:hypothetical protein